MGDILKTFYLKLTDLSGNNRSLRLLKLYGRQALDMHSLDFAYSATDNSFSIIQKIIAKQPIIPLCAAVDASDSSSNRLSFALSQLSRQEKLIEQERGVQDLYIGWPFVTGQLLDGTVIRAPLVFFPVSLSQKNSMWYLKNPLESPILFNKSLLLAYSYFNKQPLFLALMEQNLRELPSEPVPFLTGIYESIKESTLDIHFGQDFFSEQLKLFKEFATDSLTKQTKQGQLRVSQEAVIGIFPQSGSFLVPDYMELMQKFSGMAVEDLFPKVNKQGNVKEENTYTVYDTDEYQESAINRVKSGESIVVIGPPGSGKSQLVANLMTDFMARGKNVLLISQKRAALDVVASRLKDKELLEFCAPIHDFRADRKALYTQIARQIHRVEDYERANKALDTVQLERRFLQSSRRIEAYVEQLSEYREALFDTAVCGKSIKSLYLEAINEIPAISLQAHIGELDYPTLEKWENDLFKCFSYQKYFNTRPLFWQDGVKFANKDPAYRQTLIEHLHSINRKHNLLQNKYPSAPDFDTCLYLLPRIDKIELLRQNLDGEQVFQIFSKLAPLQPDENIEWLTEKEKQLFSCFEGLGMENSISAEEMGHIQEVVEKAYQARKHIWSWVRWRWSSKEHIYLSRVLIGNGLKATRDGLEMLQQKIDNRLNYEHLLSTIKSKEWLKDVPVSTRKTEIQNWFYYRKIALQLIQNTAEIRQIGWLVSLHQGDRKEVLSQLDNLALYLKEFSEIRTFAQFHLSSNQADALLGITKNYKEAIAELEEDFESYCGFHTLLNNLPPSLQAVVHNQTEDTNAPEFRMQKFKESLAWHWIQVIETKYPVLRKIGTPEWEHDLLDLKNSIRRKQEDSLSIVQLKLRERVVSDMSYNRLNNRLTYRDLEHQVTKKRQQWPIRKLLAEFGDELMRLVPCWMASPETVSALFPIQHQFDLVIFDESSQCFTEKAIPAILRARQLVIAGDPHQLKPFDLYQSRWTPDEDTSIDEELDSLMDFSLRHLPSIMLQGHYRSISLPLIEFSNQWFYKQSLRPLPQLHTLHPDHQSIFYHQVEGEWKNYKNLQEAEAVVKLVLTLRNQHTSIGIITFNSQQRDLIMDRLDHSWANWQEEMDGFVKNIDNVQGDERDIIIFSTAYSRNKKGKLSLQFGSLNTPGGGNRLNVAITRARKEIHMVTSLWPDDFHIREDASEGARLLAHYMKYAWQCSRGEFGLNMPQQRTVEGSLWLKDHLLPLAEPFTYSFTFPMADLVIAHRNIPVGCVLTDDKWYHESGSPKGPYFYHETQFHDKQWPHIRMTSRSYFYQKKKVKDTLQQFILRLTQNIQ